MMDAAIRSWCRALGNYPVPRALSEAHGARPLDRLDAKAPSMPFKPPRPPNLNVALNERRVLAGTPTLVVADKVTRERAFAPVDAAQLPHARKTLLRRLRA